MQRIQQNNIRLSSQNKLGSSENINPVRVVRTPKVHYFSKSKSKSNLWCLNIPVGYI